MFLGKNAERKQTTTTNLKKLRGESATGKSCAESQREKKYWWLISRTPWRRWREFGPGYRVGFPGAQGHATSAQPPPLSPLAENLTVAPTSEQRPSRALRRGTWRSLLLSGSAGEITPPCLKHFLR